VGFPPRGVGRARPGFPGWRLRQRNLDLFGALDEGSAVNPITLGRTLSAACMCVTLIGCASASHDDAPKVVELGNDTYSITCEAKNAFHRDTEKLKADASAAAAGYCAAQGKQMKLVSLTSDLPMFSTGYAKAKIVFKALNAGDPGLLASENTTAVAAPAERSLTTDDLYNELLKLDDLRKKGILTDEEFQSEKKKVLNRSK